LAFEIDGSDRSFTTPEDGVLYDFTPSEPNEPSTASVPATLTLQDMKVNTVLFAMKLPFGVPWADEVDQPVWVTSGFGLYTAECSSG
jgi:hypothetical protein